MRVPRYYIFQKLFKEYKFTEQELEIYINNSFHSFGEIDKKSERHFNCK